MEPIAMVVLPGLLGGILVALIIGRFGRPAQPPRPFRRELSTDVINMASIKVAGVGGLGLVAMAVAVALDVPRIRATMALSLAVGVGIAVVMILRRRRTGSMPSSGRRMGANTTLAIDVPPKMDDPEASETGPAERLDTPPVPSHSHV